VRVIDTMTQTRAPAPSAGQHRTTVPGRVHDPRRVVGLALLALALMALSAFVRTRGLAAYYWIDEGLSVGISSHHLLAIPDLLRQDGSPPLYYLLLHVWMGLTGPGEQATRLLSVVIATLAVPAALWSGWSLFGPRCGWVCAIVAALDPFLTTYAQETRMYALVVLLSLLASTFVLHAFAFGRRRYLPLLAVALAALLYTHDWGVFLAAGMGAGVLVALRGGDRRRLLVDASLAFGGAALLFAPWLGTLLFQSRHTGAPWAQAPTWRAIQQIPTALLGGPVTTVVVVVVVVAGVRLALRGGPGPHRRPLLLAMTAMGATMLVAWLFSQASPAWADRYFAVFLGPLLLVAGVGLSRLRRVGAGALAAAALVWLAGVHEPARTVKSNAAAVAQTVAANLRPGDLVLDTHPEEVPLLYHYLPAGLDYATPIGSVGDPAVMNWIDALGRLRRAQVATTLEPLLGRLPAGARIVLVQPIINHPGQWRGPWTRLVRRRAVQWSRALAADPRFRRLGGDLGNRLGSAVLVRATVYRKRQLFGS